MSVRIAWERRGAGQPVVLIHGLGYARWGWNPVVSALAARFEVILLDNRGIGDSDAPPGPYTVAALADDVLGVLDEAELASAYVIGTSLGGMVAQELALEHPERVERLVLVCTTPGGADALPFPEETVRLLERAPGLAPEVALRLFVENALAPDTVERRPELVEEILAQRLATAQSPAAWAAQAAAAATFDASSRLGGMVPPTLVLHGTDDRVVDARNATLLGRLIRGAQVELLGGAGHLLCWEQPERFVELVSRFLDEGST